MVPIYNEQGSGSSFISYLYRLLATVRCAG
jgi:hypothetical protein